MSRQRLIVLFVAALVAISGAMYLSAQRNLARDPRGAPLLPSLANELNTVTALSVRKGSPTPTVTVHKQGDNWTVVQRADYPADVSKVRKLLLALSDTRILEEKTSDPARYSIIGVEDPSTPEAAGAEIDWTAQDGSHGVIVGKPVGEGNFVRRSGEKASYSVAPRISFEAEPKFWIDGRLPDVKVEDIQSIAVTPAAGPSYSIRKSGDRFTLDAVPKGRDAADPKFLAPSASTFSGLSADDVAAAGDIDFSQASTAAIALADGDVVTLTGAAIGDKHWLKIASAKHAELNAKTEGRAYQIAGYRYDSIFKPLDQMLVPKPPASDAKKPAPAKKQ
jgi:Domain of unknown function (DUF4340)